MKNNNTIPNGFKETPLGPIPEDWDIKKLSDFLELIRNGTTRKQNTKGKGLPVTRIETISEEKINISKVRHIEEISDEEIEKYKLQKGDILISHINSEKHLGKCAIYEGEPEILIHGMNLLLFRTKKEFLDPNFLYYLFKRYRSTGIFIGLASRAVNQASINQGKLKSLLIPLPDIQIQKMIAAVLSAVQEAKEKTEAVITTARALKKSLMKHLFTYGPVSLEETDNVKLKETEIGIIPEDWDIKKLNKLFYVKQGKQLSAKESKEGKIKKPFLRTSNIYWGKINTSKVDKMLFTQEEFEKFKLKDGDILVCEGGDIGRTALYRGELYETAYQNHLHRLRPKTKEANCEFFVYWMNYAINQKGLYVFFGNITTIPNLSGSRLKNFDIPISGYSKQEQISSILSSADSKIEKEEDKKKALEELFKTLLNKLMTGRIRVHNLEVGE